MRKTIQVEKLKDKVNGMIRDLPDSDIAGRIALQTIIENVLMDSGNYRGFSYLDTRDMTDSRGGTTVGVNTIDPNLDWTGKSSARHKAQFDNTDHTRVRYF